MKNSIKKLAALTLGLTLSLHGWGSNAGHHVDTSCEDKDGIIVEVLDESSFGQMHKAALDAFGFSLEHLEQYQTLPSGDAIQKHLDEQGYQFSEEELEEMRSVTSAGSYLSPNMNRVMIVAAAALSYAYPQAWPVTFFFLLYDHSALRAGAEKYLGKGGAMYAFMTAYFTAVVHQANQGVHEFRKFLQKHGYDPYWMWGVGGMMSLREYIRYYGLPFGAGV